MQDGTLVKAASTGLGKPAAIGTTIGSNVTIGHNATLRACTIADASLIGMDATILEGAQVNVLRMVLSLTKHTLLQASAYTRTIKGTFDIDFLGSGWPYVCRVMCDIVPALAAAVQQVEV